MLISPLRQNTNTNANTKYGIKTSKTTKRNRQYRTDEQTRRLCLWL